MQEAQFYQQISIPFEQHQWNLASNSCGGWHVFTSAT